MGKTIAEFLVLGVFLLAFCFVILLLGSDETNQETMDKNPKTVVKE